MGLFETYHADYFDEVVDNEQVREHYRPLVERLDSFEPHELDSRVSLTEAIFRRQGITFAVADSDEGIERTWPLDLVPRLITPNRMATRRVGSHSTREGVEQLSG